MSMKRVYNFNAGPAAMPLEVLNWMKDGFMDFGGMSILEISHRSKEFQAVIDEARALLAELMGVPETHDILLLQGGAAQQFAVVPMNLMDRTADYAITGHWSKQALKEAQIVGEPKVIFTSEGENFTRVPRASEIKPGPDASYVHITTNNTIFGTEYYEYPDTGKVPLVADMSSDILSRRMDISKFGLLYAGAQKNLGPAGVTVVVIRKDLLERSPRKLPVIFRYKTHSEKGSLYNTPPVFSIYTMMLYLRWVKSIGGVDEIERRNVKKAEMLYDAIDRCDLYKGTTEKASRSRMNVTYVLPSQELTDKFVAGAKEKGIVGIKGHRSVGGIRASLYNAVSEDAVQALTGFMDEFRRNA
ncbi:MAG: 3-phosphoserine/phosphohydroxythreonine transaminase [Proteobacteria bacterium]|nr:3-phosphoserine/phosphohydroxythreonine transaminase [Pseudomonadota bacterium]